MDIDLNRDATQHQVQGNGVRRSCNQPQRQTHGSCHISQVQTASSLFGQFAGGQFSHRTGPGRFRDGTGQPAGAQNSDGEHDRIDDCLDPHKRRFGIRQPFNDLPLVVQEIEDRSDQIGNQCQQRHCDQWKPSDQRLPTSGSGMQQFLGIRLQAQFQFMSQLQARLKSVFGLRRQTALQDVRQTKSLAAREGRD